MPVAHLSFLSCVLQGARCGDQYCEGEAKDKPLRQEGNHICQEKVC